MSVNSVSLVFHFALKNAGMPPQIAPAMMLATALMAISSPFGTVSARQIMHAAAARQPARIWPSPPMFQNLMRNAGVTASDTPRSIAVFWASIQTLRSLPKELSIMVA